MSYLRKPMLGDVLSTLQTVASAAQIAQKLSVDPALPEMKCRAQQIMALEDKKPVPPCAVTNPGPGGLGLRRALVPVRAYIYSRQHLWVKPAAIAVVVGVPFLLGYLAGSRS